MLYFILLCNNGYYIIIIFFFINEFNNTGRVRHHPIMGGARLYYYLQDRAPLGCYYYGILFRVYNTGGKGGWKSLKRIVGTHLRING